MIMYAISFDMTVSDLKDNYGEPYNQAYYEIGDLLKKFDFERKQGSLYVSEKDDLAALFGAIEKLKSVEWFKKSVRDIRGFRIESWSDFTKSVKGNTY